MTRTSEHPDGAAPAFCVAVVGSGPAGLFAADELLRRNDVTARVDVIDRLPTPYGLVRYGVAPDHPKIKSIIRTLQRVLESPRVRFLGGVDFGIHLSRDDLRSHYDAVVYATGASVDRRLGIPGENLPGCHSATEFVSWYSGHPDAAQPFELDAESVAVIGVGNVAVDVARILVKGAGELQHTDMPLDVLEMLGRSRVRDVHIIGRRGAEHAKFTTKELRELGELAEAEVIVDPAEFSAGADSADKQTRANLAVLERWVTEHPRGQARRIRLRFWLRPVEVVGDGRVEGLRVERTRLDPDGALRGTGQFQTIPVQLVLRAVGYRSVPLPGVPFDEARGVVPNHRGRVLDRNGRVVPCEYVAGWLKRGPSGVIGTNKLDSAETVAALVEDLRHRPAHRIDPSEAVDRLLAERGIEPVTYHGWLNIDTHEIQRGVAEGRSRTKITDWGTLRRLGTEVGAAPAQEGTA